MVLERRRIYILPTRAGLYFAVLVFVMLMGAMNYSNSLAFSLTFLLAGMGLVCMHHTHSNLVNLSLKAARQEPVFAGEPACFALDVENPSASPRFSVRLDHNSLSDAASNQPITEPVHSIDVAANGQTAARIHTPTQRRGLLPAPRIRVYTEYPMGLFRAWSWVRLDVYCLVYPKPAGSFSLPQTTPGGNYGQAEMHAGREDFAGLRKYERGDPPRLIHWKAYPRTGKLMIKQFADPREAELWLDWQLSGSRNTETMLSQLTRWVLEADRLALNYGLRLPNIEIPAGQGAHHRQRCLRELALHDSDAQVDAHANAR